MNDLDIIELYFARNEQAIKETEEVIQADNNSENLIASTNSVEFSQ